MQKQLIMFEQAGPYFQHAQAADVTIMEKREIGRRSDGAKLTGDFAQSGAAVNHSLGAEARARHCVNSAIVNARDLPCRHSPARRIADHAQHIELRQRHKRLRLEKITDVGG